MPQAGALEQRFLFEGTPEQLGPERGQSRAFQSLSAPASSLTIRNRALGDAVRGSSLALSPSSSVVILTATLTRPKLAISRNRSRSRIAVDATVFATLVGVDRLIEGHVRRPVGGDDVSGQVPKEFRARVGRRKRLVFRLFPAVVDGDAGCLVESACRIRQRAASLDAGVLSSTGTHYP